MGATMSLFRSSLFIGLLICLASCQTSDSTIPSPPLPVPPSLSIPHDVQRIAIFYPKPSSPDLAEAYNRLEGATFQLKLSRRNLKIVDRFHLRTLLDEHRFQLTGAVADESVIRMGRILGVDSVLLYRIYGPSVRDRFWASRSSDLPPITVFSKLVRVESAEVLYHHVVTTRFEDSTQRRWAGMDSIEYQRLSRDAIERGIQQTVMELRRALE